MLSSPRLSLTHRLTGGFSCRRSAAPEAARLPNALLPGCKACELQSILHFLIAMLSYAGPTPSVAASVSTQHTPAAN